MTSNGPAYVYVVPTVHEDLLKLGFSRDPLARLQALHARWFEFFDLQRGLLVQTETVAEARALELRQQRRLQEHRAPAPLTALRAGGGREWFRGAFAPLSAFADDCAAEGYFVHRPLAPWLRTRLLAGAALLHDWCALLASEELEARGVLALASPAQRRVLDVLDAYLASGIALDAWVPQAVLDWHREARRCASAS